MATVRPTKKQRELLDFIEQFIRQHGYSPSYREIMNGCDYTSIATVAVHINNLISRGHLRKRDHSARSLELTRTADGSGGAAADTTSEGDEAWLLARLDAMFDQAEKTEQDDGFANSYNGIQVLMAALRILGLEEAAQERTARLQALKQRFAAGTGETTET